MLYKTKKYNKKKFLSQKKREIKINPKNSETKDRKEW